MSEELKPKKDHILWNAEQLENFDKKFQDFKHSIEMQMRDFGLKNQCSVIMLNGDLVSIIDIRKPYEDAQENGKTEADSLTVQEFKNYLLKEFEEGKTEFRIITQNEKGFDWYIHPIGKAGNTFDFYF
jgi:hypothetical protein